MAFGQFDQVVPYSSAYGSDYGNYMSFNSFMQTPYLTSEHINRDNQIITGPPMMMGPTRPFNGGSAAQAENCKSNALPKIKNMKQLYRLFGRPDVIDTYKGGIAIWSAATLRKAHYGFLHRVEIIDESVPSIVPVNHFSNLYIWVHMTPNREQLNNILSLSKDYFYDRKKELMIVRSDTLDTAVAQAALLLLYVKEKVTFYNLVNNDMIKIYYSKISTKVNSKSWRKVKKAIYTIINTATVKK